MASALQEEADGDEKSRGEWPAGRVQLLAKRYPTVPSKLPHRPFKIYTPLPLSIYPTIPFRHIFSDFDLRRFGALATQ